EFDRGEKWLRYQRWLSKLTDYVMVAQDEPRVEQYARGKSGEWIYSVVKGLENEIQIESINCPLKLSEIYARVTFPEPKPERPDQSFEDILRAKGLR
ncbi:MAG TPA: hypothetical protein VHD88_00200, partial [Pyrinomonadaceae bacterium]|nr:hypothetical protein [Pyrinomonadaceae bacterium]